jgi:AraC family transcriptional regulator
MDESVRQAVARAIVTMHENLGDHVTIDDLARSAMFSKFHFTRIFQRTTGLSPGRFLSALRLTEAKRLLVTTSYSVADISHQVGYNSVGTFSARFSGSVGLSPTRYRQLRGRPQAIPERTGAPGCGTTVRGQLWCPAEVEFGPVFVGLFPGRIAEGPPARSLVLPAPGPYAFPDVPTGGWYVVVHGFGVDHREDRGPRAYTGIGGPLTARRGLVAGIADVRVRSRWHFDPPPLLALPDLRHVPTRQPIAV